MTKHEIRLEASVELPKLSRADKKLYRRARALLSEALRALPGDVSEFDKTNIVQDVIVPLRAILVDLERGIVRQGRDLLLTHYASILKKKSKDL